MPSTVLVDIAGRRRSPATLPGFHAGSPPRNRVFRYPADPPTVEEIIAVMRVAGAAAEGVRLRGLIVVLWRARYGSARHLRLARATSTRAEARSWCDTARAASAVRLGWTAGPGRS
jgi:hypothetical protein